MLEGVRAVRPVGVHHRRRPGQAVFTGVVVGDDQVHPQLPGIVGLVQGGDATVHRDNKPHPLAGLGGHGLPVQAIALLQPPGDIGLHIGPQVQQKLGQQAGGGDAVHVIVAVDGDGLPVVDGPPHPGSSFVHVPHEHGVQQRLGLGGEEPPGILRVRHPPGGQHRRQQGGQAALLQGPPPVGAGGGHVPLLEFHMPRPPFCPAAHSRAVSGYFNLSIIAYFPQFHQAKIRPNPADGPEKHRTAART